MVSNGIQYPHVFEETVLENLKSWVMEETARSGDDHYWRHESGEGKSTDSEMLKTYSTGLLAVCLARYSFETCYVVFFSLCRILND